MEDLAKDLTTVKALQRKHKGIERELAPIKDKVVQVSQLGKDVIDGFPSERAQIEQTIREVQEKWEMLENKAMDRSKRLEDAVGMQLFTSGVRTLLQWVDDTKNALNTNENVRDVQVKLNVNIRAANDPSVFKNTEKARDCEKQWIVCSFS